MNRPRAQSEDRTVAIQSLRESVLDFMTSNPVAWRTKALAVKLGVDVMRLGPELLQLNVEGKLVSCTVTAPGRRTQEEYRIAAILLKPNPREFVISRATNVRLRANARPRKCVALDAGSSARRLRTTERTGR